MKYIYLHGFLSGPDSHKGRFLENRFRELGHPLLRPDLNGGDFEHMTISSQLQMVNELIGDAGEKITLLGSSLGGYLAALAAENHPGVRRLVLMAPAFDFVNRYLATFSEQALAEWKRRGYIELFHYHHQQDRRLSYGIVADGLQYRDRSFGRQLPVLACHGIRDASVPYQVSVDYLQAHPMTDLLLLNSDHGLLDKLDVMWDYIKAFLKL